MSATTQEISAIFDESRNGANQFFRHPLNRRFIYSDGVHEVAEKAGAYWLLNILAIEFASVYGKAWVKGECGLGVVYLDVNDSNEATITLSLDDDHPPAYTRHVDYTDFPQGRWTFYINAEEGGLICILPAEY